tara:strand:+ start:254 stop:799 length:546 start_codon:yes stop_codon:yes gene_type:complete
VSATYTIEEHNHRLAAWGAGSAASVRNVCTFRVQTGVEILEASGFGPNLSEPDQLPAADEMDKAHQKWRKRVINEAAVHHKNFSHGQAAKLINSYLKVRFVCGGFHEHPKVQSLHPPIDRLLLDSLSKDDVGGFGKEWRTLRDRAWSKFTSEEYQKVIDLIRRTVQGRPLWVIEQYWQGHQ